MSAAVWVPVNGVSLPWDRTSDDSRRLRRWLAGCLLLTAVVGLVMPLLPLPPVEREVLEALPPQLARIALEKPEPVAPPPEPAVQRPAAPKPEPERATEAAPRAAAETKPAPRPTVAEAREKAAISGLLAFKDTFADMRDAVDRSRLQETAAIQQGEGKAATLDRSVLTSSQASRSAGVDVAALSRDTGGVALAGRETTKVAAPEGHTGEGGVREARAIDLRQRSIEDVRRVFDANKGAIFAIYNRALRSDPTLQGKVVLELVISPSGEVADISVVASELSDASLVAKILSRVRLFDFGQRDVGTTTISYPVHFLPS